MNHDYTKRTMRLAPTAVITLDGPGWLVKSRWPNAGVDRVNGMGWTVTRLDVAKRLVVAIEAGAVLTNPTIKTDVNDNTYVSASSQVLGRQLNADLRRLGY